MDKPMRPRRAAVHVDQDQIRAAVDQAVQRALGGKRTIPGPILVGIIAYPVGDKLEIADIQSTLGVEGHG